tara:strand:- start:3506 stop:3883 length:378 start_codon:yes stop_codon:yes gene_type:complete
MKRNYYFPQEVEVWYILPAIRKQMALDLLQEGMSQKAIAAILKLTEAAISQYKKNKRVKDDLFNKKIKDEIKKASKKIMNEPDAALHEIMNICELVKKEKVICKMHLKKSGLKEEDLPCGMCVAQ